MDDIEKDIPQKELDSEEKEENEKDEQMKELIDLCFDSKDLKLLFYFGDCVNTKDHEKFSSILIEIANVSQCTLLLLKKSIRKEFRDQIESNQLSTIFRGNTLSSKIVTSYNKNMAKKYLRDLFSDLLNDLSKTKDIIFPYTKETQSSEKLEKDKISLEALTNKILDRILEEKSIEMIPNELRKVFTLISKYAQKLCSDRKYIVLCAMFYLRLINAALLAPKEFQILNDEKILSPQCVVNLIEVTKLFQHSSNNSLIDKHPHIIFNDWIKNHTKCFLDLLDKISNETLEEKLVYNKNYDVKKIKNLSIFHSVLHEIKDDIVQKINAQKDSLEEKSFNELKEKAKKVKEIVEKIGDPKTVLQKEKNKLAKKILENFSEKEIAVQNFYNLMLNSSTGVKRKKKYFLSNDAVDWIKNILSIDDNLQAISILNFMAKQTLVVSKDSQFFEENVNSTWKFKAKHQNQIKTEKKRDKYSSLDMSSIDEDNNNGKKNKKLFGTFKKRTGSLKMPLNLSKVTVPDTDSAPNSPQNSPPNSSSPWRSSSPVSLTSMMESDSKKNKKEKGKLFGKFFKNNYPKTEKPSSEDDNSSKEEKPFKETYKDNSILSRNSLELEKSKDQFSDNFKKMISKNSFKNKNSAVKKKNKNRNSLPSSRITSKIIPNEDSEDEEMETNGGNKKDDKRCENSRQVKFFSSDTSGKKDDIFGEFENLKENSLDEKDFEEGIDEEESSKEEDEEENLKRKSNSIIKDYMKERSKEKIEERRSNKEELDKEEFKQLDTKSKIKKLLERNKEAKSKFRTRTSGYVYKETDDFGNDDDGGVILPEFEKVIEKFLYVETCADVSEDGYDTTASFESSCDLLDSPEKQIKNDVEINNK